MEAEVCVADVASVSCPVLAKARIPPSCLLCWKPVADSGAREEEGAYLEIVGAQGVKSLEEVKQLTQWLILRKLLGLTAEWCQENVFSGAPEDDNQLADKEWFRVCHECLHSSVREVWFIHRQMLSLERRVEKIRLQVKKKMRNGATKTNQAREAGGISSKIRQLLVPEIGEMTQLPPNPTATDDTAELAEEDKDSVLAEDDAGSSCGSQECSAEEVVSSKDDLRLEERTLAGEEEQIAEGDTGHEDHSAEMTPSKAASQMETKCRHCEFSSADLSEMRRHWKKHRKEGTFSWKCDKCDKVYSARRLLRNHQRVTHDNMEGRTCPHCQRQFFSAGFMERHSRFVCIKNPNRENGGVKGLKRESHRRKTYSCVDCSEAPFPNLEEFQSHQRLHQERKLSPVVDDAGQSLDCDQCSFPAGDYQQLLLHIRQRHEPCWGRRTVYKCPAITECTRTTLKWWVILKHVTVGHSEEVKLQLFQRYLYCDQCSFRGDLPRDLYWHRQKCHKPVEESGGVLKCSDCGVLCTSAEELNRHVNTTHRRINRFICDVCGKGFIDRLYLKKHSVVHNKHLQPRNWVCDLCGVDFPLQDSLLTHVRKLHTDKEGGEGKVHHCSHCELTSPFRAVILKHMEETHRRESQWKCDKCGKGYLDKSALGRHHTLMHSDKQQVVPCPHCHRGFPNRHYMLIHVRRNCKIKRLQDLAVGGKPGKSGIEGRTWAENQ